MARWNLDDWRSLREALLNPRVDPEQLAAAIGVAREKQPLPVLWPVSYTHLED